MNSNARPTPPKPSPQVPDRTGHMEDPSPRAFAIGTGLVFIMVGAALTLGTCCLASISGLIVLPDSSASQFPNLFMDWVAARIMIATLAGALLSGLGLLAVGVGLYGERPSAGPLAVVTTIGFSAFFSMCAALTYGSNMGLAVTATVLAVGMFVLVPFAVAARKTLRMFPPPPDQHEFRNGNTH